MRKDHLTTKQVEQYCQTGYLGTGERAHMAGCPQCQRLVSDLRVIGRLLAKASPAEDEVHPTQDELQAFHDEALGFGRMKEVEAHLASCDHCLARVMELRVRDAELEYSTPTLKIIETVRKQFQTPGRVRKLGQLIIQTIRDTGDVLLRLDPVSAVTSGRQIYGNVQSLEQARYDLMPTEEEDQVVEHKIESLASYLPRESIKAHRRPIRASELPRDTVQTASDDHRIRIKVSREDDSFLLHLSISTYEEGEPARHLKVSLFAEDDLTTDAITDQTGSAVLPLPAGPALLQIDADPPIQLSIAGAD